jgi:hypothetical protein
VRIASGKRKRAARWTRAGTGLYLINVTDTRERVKARARGAGEGGRTRPLRILALVFSGDSGVCAISNGERATLLARYLKRVSRRRERERERERKLESELSSVMQAYAYFSSALRRLNLTSTM